MLFSGYGVSAATITEIELRELSLGKAHRE